MTFSLAQMDTTGWLLTPGRLNEIESAQRKRTGQVTRTALLSNGPADSHMPSIFISLLGQPQLQPSGVVMPYRVIISTRYSLG